MIARQECGDHCGRKRDVKLLVFPVSGSPPQRQHRECREQHPKRETWDYSMNEKIKESSDVRHIFRFEARNLLVRFIKEQESRIPCEHLRPGHSRRDQYQGDGNGGKPLQPDHFRRKRRMTAKGTMNWNLKSPSASTQPAQK